MMNPRLLDTVWLLLMVLTGATWWIGDSGSAGPAAVMAILAIATGKGGMVISEFMALRQVKAFWPGLVGGWLLLVLVIILGTYWKGL